jgi:hypothetical protein
MSTIRTKTLLRHVQLLYLVGAAIFLLLSCLIYFWIGAKNYSAPQQTELRLRQSFLMAVTTNMVPVFVVLVGSYVFLRRIQVIQSEIDREALTAAIADAVRADLAESIRTSGVHDVFRRFYVDVPWGRLFPNTNDFDLIVSYARTWKNTHNEALRKIAANHRARIRIVLADPDNPVLMAELARRYSVPQEKLTSYVRESLIDFQALCATGSADCHIHVSSRACLYTYYRFDEDCVLSLFSNVNSRSDRPGFLLNGDGELTRFLREEFEAYFTDSKPFQNSNTMQPGHV